MKYIDADILLEKLVERLGIFEELSSDTISPIRIDECKKIIGIIDSLQQEQPMPDSTQLIAEWEKEKAVLEQKDFRGDAERMAYNAFLDGFVKGLGYGRTK